MSKSGRLVSLRERTIVGVWLSGSSTGTADRQPKSIRKFLGVVGAVFILIFGLLYLNWRRKQAAARGEGYGEGQLNEPEPFAEQEKLPNPWIAILPLVLVGVLNKVFTTAIPGYYSNSFTVPLPGHPLTIDVSKVAAIWAVEAALIVGIVCVLVFAFKRVMARFAEGTKAAIAGSPLASMNTASEYGGAALSGNLQD